MKTALKLFALLAAAGLWSCSNSDDNNASPSGNGTTVDEVTGNWKVSYYYDNGKDETADYTSYSFTFNADGVFQAASGSQSYAGTWSLGEKNDDSSSASNKLVISITGNDKINHLSDDWLILSISNSEIKLKDDSSNSIEELHFVRD